VTIAESVATFATLSKLDFDVIFGRASCSNAVEVAEEVLGSSDGSIDQRFYLANVPVLDLTLLVDEGGGFQVWREVDDFSGSNPHDQHYVLNRGTGTVLFGDGRHGKAPAGGFNNVKAAPYRFGGGTKGNVGAGTLTRLRDTHPFVASVVNKEAAAGGGDEETVEEAILRGPSEQLKTRNRAVTAEDFEILTLESSTGIARAKTLALFDPAEPAVPKPGLVSVIVLPKGRAPLSLALRAQITDYLDRRRLVTTQIFVVEADFVPFEVQVKVAKTDEANPVTLEAALKAVIREFYDPEFGGDPVRAVDVGRQVSTERGEGWPFGRDIFLSELFELLERVPGVDHVDEIVEPAATVAIEGHQLPDLQDVVVTVV
jgi:predicted phage baseplate assembly protein